MATIVYTDGACRGNPGPGGWAWAMVDGPDDSGHDPATTNQRMEVKAAFEAVRSNPGPLEIRSDSTYVVNCFRNKWHEGWLRRGWKNSQKQPVANRDLWEPFIELVLARGDVEFTWVKGHSGEPMNDLVDRLAVEASHGSAPEDVVADAWLADAEARLDAEVTADREAEIAADEGSAGEGSADDAGQGSFF